MKEKLIQKIKNGIPFHTGTEPEFSVEHQLFNLVCFFAGAIGFGTVIINLILDTSLILKLMPISVAVFCWLAFYMSRFKKKFNVGKWILGIFIFIAFTFIYFINNGSYGPLLYLYLVFFLFILFIWNGRSRILMAALFVINIVGLAFIELKYPDLIHQYDNNTDRVLDLFLSYFLFVIMGGVILLFAKNSYKKEKIRAEKSDKLKSAFLANMSHEIRTPMNAILGFTQLLQDDVSEEKREMYLRIINENSHSLLRIIEDIIDISKIEAGELRINEEEVNLKQLLNSISSTFKQLIAEHPEKKILIVPEYPDEDLPIFCDSTRVKQVLTNLMSNAFKNTEEGRIRIGYTIEKEFIRFSVNDTGIGIDEKDIQEIFKRFSKLETKGISKILPGTGIGLPISKNLVELMGGEIGVISEIGIGSEFFFTLPLKRAHQGSLVNKSIARETLKDEFMMNNMHVLVAEDDEINFQFLKKVLESKGARVFWASNGREAVKFIESDERIDIVFMDIMMPEMNGYEATSKIKEINPSLPVIAQTALAMEGDESKIREAGCDDYISKPIRLNELYAKIARVIPVNSL